MVYECEVGSDSRRPQNDWYHCWLGKSPNACACLTLAITFLKITQPNVILYEHVYETQNSNCSGLPSLVCTPVGEHCSNPKHSLLVYYIRTSIPRGKNKYPNELGAIVHV